MGIKMCKGGCRKSILERIYGLFAVPIHSPFPLQGFLVNNGAGTLQEPFLSLGLHDCPLSSGSHEQEKQCLQG